MTVVEAGGPTRTEYVDTYGTLSAEHTESGVVIDSSCLESVLRRCDNNGRHIRTEEDKRRTYGLQIDVQVDEGIVQQLNYRKATNTERLFDVKEVTRIIHISFEDYIKLGRPTKIRATYETLEGIN